VHVESRLDHARVLVSIRCAAHARGTTKKWRLSATLVCSPSNPTPSLHSISRKVKHLAFLQPPQVCRLSTYKALGCAEQPRASPALLCTQTTQSKHQYVGLSSNPMATRILFSFEHQMTLPTTSRSCICTATRHNSVGRTDKFKHLRTFRLAFRTWLTKLPLVGPHPVKPQIASCLRLLQTFFIIEQALACAMVVPNSSTGAVLRRWTHTLNARDVGIASSPWPPGANLAGP